MGTNLINTNMPKRDDYKWVHITGVATTQIIGVACKLININVNTTGAGTIVAYNATTANVATSNIIGVLKASIVEGTYLDDGKKIPTALTVVTNNASHDITVTYAEA